MKIKLRSPSRRSNNAFVRALQGIGRRFSLIHPILHITANRISVHFIDVNVTSLIFHMTVIIINRH